MLAPLLRRRVREEWILAGALVVPSMPLVFAARSYGRAALVVAAAAIAAGVRLRPARLRQPAAARRRRRRPRAGVRALRDAVPARVGAGRSARGGLPGGRPGGIFLVALVLLFAGLSYVGAVRRPAPRPTAERPAKIRRRGDGAARVERADAVRDSRRSPTPSCRRCSRSTGAASARRRDAPTGPTAGARASSIARGAHSSAATHRRLHAAYTFELTMPGGALVPVAAVSSVAVQPTHRRRGVLTAMIGALHDDARGARRDRVGAHRVGERDLQALRLRRRPRGSSAARSRTATRGWRGPFADAGRVRMVARGEADAVYREVYERAPRARAGMVSRPDFWWPEVFWITERGRALFDAVHEDAARPGRRLRRRTRSRASGTAASPTARCSSGICRRRTRRAGRALGVRVRRRPRGEDHATNLPPDEPLRFMLADPRQLRTDFVGMN